MNGSLNVGWLLWLLGPLLGIGVWWAEGPPSRRKPSVLLGTPDESVWDRNFRLNRLLIALMYATFITVLVLPVLMGRPFTVLNAFGAFACGCLAWMLTLTLISWPHVRARYSDLQRFARLRYGYNANSPLLILSGALFALGWIPYVLLRV
jgi:hypothetical protein